MSIEWLIDAFRLPPQALVAHRIPKKLLVEQVSPMAADKHLKAIFAEGELAEDSVVNQWLTTAADGKSYRVSHYNLEAVLP